MFVHEIFCILTYICNVSVNLRYDFFLLIYKVFASYTSAIYTHTRKCFILDFNVGPIEKLYVGRSSSIGFCSSFTNLCLFHERILQI